MPKQIVSGIYVILNVKSRKIYLGQAQSIRKRWDDHRSALNRNKHKNRHLQAAWNKYGADSFKFQILEYCSVETLSEREQHYLNIYMPKGLCYNLSPEVGTTRGIRHSEASRKRMSEAQKRRTPITNETRHKLSVAMKDRVFTDEHRRRLSEANTGHRHSAETRQKFSTLRKGQKRKPLSAETRQRISDSEKGKTVSAETRQKISEAHKGKPAYNKGVSPSEETKHKMSEAAKLRHARNRALKNGDEP